jgi:hypothetical protein
MSVNVEFHNECHTLFVVELPLQPHSVFWDWCITHAAELTTINYVRFAQKINPSIAFFIKQLDLHHIPYEYSNHHNCAITFAHVSLPWPTPPHIQFFWEFMAKQADVTLHSQNE